MRRQGICKMKGWLDGTNIGDELSCDYVFTILL